MSRSNATRQRLPNLRHLHILLHVTRTGSANAAARAAHLSQPAVTQAIAALEREYGQPLFTRTSRGMTPTAAGLALAARVERALIQLQGGVEDALRSGRVVSRDRMRALTSAQLVALTGSVEAGAFGRAARAAGVARATIQRAARQLEQVLGVPLFETTSHGIRPTLDAEHLARRVSLAASELEQAAAEVAAHAGIERGGTTIGAMPLARSLIVPLAVLAFADSHPRHRVAILDGPYESLLEALRRGRADVLVGALRNAVPEDVVQERLFDDPLCIIVRRAHPLAGGVASRRKRIDPARFAWIAPREGSPLRLQFDQLFATGSRHVPEPIECNSLVAARAMLLASDRAMLLSAHQVRHELAAGQLVALPHPAGRVVRPIGLTLRREWRPTSVQSHLIELLRQYAAAASARTSVARRIELDAPRGIGKESRNTYEGLTRP